ncbi:uncharacterized protein B0J16DRAFT_322421 [Fusarium flagelliforme]|uniref:uncharacterized protein n=1 Tax=Fusarium flagelliforme TaxID=2675880 RepID=UPI001E8E730B|nr:uncharacterized protein B0J16DRAFT_322421 [Fusarium flagelliforme]KAH7183687.1 hypothetical protein B0J16DRAFT_322421 [Fusarium flagelliforme]
MPENIWGDEDETIVYDQCLGNGRALIFRFSLNADKSSQTLTNRIVNCYHGIDVLHETCIFTNRSDMRRAIWSVIAMVWSKCIGDPAVLEPGSVVDLTSNIYGEFTSRVYWEPLFQQYLDLMKIIQPSDLSPPGQHLPTLELSEIYIIEALGGRGCSKRVRLQTKLQDCPSYVFKGMDFQSYLQVHDDDDEFACAMVETWRRSIKLIAALEPHPNIQSPPKTLVSVGRLTYQQTTLRLEFLCGRRPNGAIKWPWQSLILYAAVPLILTLASDIKWFPQRQYQSVTLMSQYDSHSLENKRPGNVPTPIVRQKAVRPPFWLTKPALILFSSVFVACAATLNALDRVVKVKHGLPLTITSSEYSWTYGPTAILVIILSFWRRIDYYYKSIQPWKELQSGPTPASRSVLLDYVSPFQLQTMYKVFKMRHYQVTASILTFFILKGIILISTTLFFVQTDTHLATLDIIYQDVFNASSAWNAYWGAGYHGGRIILTGGSDKYIWKYLARLDNATANDSLWNVNDGLVTQQFRPLTSSINITSLEALVDVFVPKITCEEADLMVNLTGSEPGHPEYSWRSKTCSAGGNEPSSLCPDHKGPRFGYNTNATVCGSRPVDYTLHRVNCSSGIISPDKRFVGSWRVGLESYDIRYAITAAQYSVDLDVALKNASLGIKAIDSTSIICNAMIEKKNLGEGSHLQNLTSSSLTEMILTGLHNVANVLVADKNVPFRADKDLNNLVHPKYDEALFQLMASKMGQNYKPGVSLEPGLLENTSIAVIEGLMNEFARESLLVESRLSGTADGIGEAILQTRTVAPTSSGPFE